MDELIKEWRVLANSKALSLADRIRVDQAIAALTGEPSERALAMFSAINEMRGWNAKGGWGSRRVEETLAEAIGDKDHSFFEAAVKLRVAKQEEGDAQLKRKLAETTLTSLNEKLDEEDQTYTESGL